MALARAARGPTGSGSIEPGPLSLIPDSRLASGLQTSPLLSSFQVWASLPEADASVGMGPEVLSCGLATSRASDTLRWWQ